MDIINEVGIPPFPIGPSTITSRTIAFKLLFCQNMYIFLKQIILISLTQMHKHMRILKPLLLWLRPRNPRGTLAAVAITAYLLKRNLNMKERTESSYHGKFWRNMTITALTYDEWAHATSMLDKENSEIDESGLYDEELVRNKLQELRHRTRAGSVRDIMFCMRADLFRNLGNMCNSDLHKGKLKTSKLIREYIEEVSIQLRMICDSESEGLLLEEKLAFMRATRHSFGRSALLLSGGASLGVFHVGVVGALIDRGLLPHIITGSSAGSVVCAIVGTRSCTQLRSFLEDPSSSPLFFDRMGGVFAAAKRVMRKGALHEIGRLRAVLRDLTGNLTFQEAYDMTGRVIGITVCSPRRHEPPRFLCYLTSPNVVIWSAVAASCAFPGLFEAQELMAKGGDGEIVAYHPPFRLDPRAGSPMPARRWRDGGLEIDLPKMQLKELFNVNHFIVSQVNPHASAVLRFKDFVRVHGGKFAAKLVHVSEMEVKHRCKQLLELGFPFPGVSRVLAQDWEGDITVFIPATLSQYAKIIRDPSPVEILKAVNQGRRCIWEKLSAIKANCGIELALDESVATLNRLRRLGRKPDRAVVTGSRQDAAWCTSTESNPSMIPSWNCISHEDSQNYSHEGKNMNEDAT